jgi:hypothetical protein
MRLDEWVKETAGRLREVRDRTSPGSVVELAAFRCTYSANVHAAGITFSPRIRNGSHFSPIAALEALPAKPRGLRENRQNSMAVELGRPDILTEALRS